MALKISSVILLALLAVCAQAQTLQPPPASERCPSPWGPDDERGYGNLQGPETVLRAARLIRTGEVIEPLKIKGGTG